ncbi:amidase [Alkalihalobacillus alcalophilus ATCC 27647 = CGMCC 1.3604]|uniref:Amidase n=1 Tax=Alkalihalobacillus alcalophilus ATCC 27647 = CGMCC 1.3604 TaxID=1218173 RepID=A0A094WFX5_ALKAL|nr:amidase [Alkalihalobacillus alcalophilus]KGA96674.1 amidase [Alkalihalobacillus alcalophilus ATCC 27647 = CGMCC 1.3604]MED1562394.1 amidase [Alkalihalobacillus alcalophilus]THG89043.1 amidase [Alkalihalobacillus alcalophilus ATCC 27647 = CGMCC 1.3604]
MSKQLNPYIQEELTLEPLATGILSGKSFAVKDVFAIEGYTSTAGNPNWFATHKPAEETAEVITILRNNGAKMIGTTITDELMYSLNGENIHYGTPVNPKAPTRIPGGSSSGSASVVAAGLVDFAIGTDTGGSVRIPSSYCGIYGFRPTHGAVSVDGLIPLAKSFDTVGWMTEDKKLLIEIARLLISSQEKSESSFRKLLFPEDAWALVDKETNGELLKTIEKVKEVMPTHELIMLEENGLSTWKEIFRIIQGYEIWQEHGEWVSATNPQFGPGIKERFAMASKITEEEFKQMAKLQAVIKERLFRILTEDTLLIVPTVPGVAPLLNLPEDQVEERRSKTLQLSAIAGLAGLPQVTIPIDTNLEAPISVSIIAGPSQDIRLLEWVNKLEAN